MNRQVPFGVVIAAGFALGMGVGMMIGHAAAGASASAAPARAPWAAALPLTPDPQTPLAAAGAEDGQAAAPNGAGDRSLDQLHEQALRALLPGPHHSRLARADR